MILHYMTGTGLELICSRGTYFLLLRSFYTWFGYVSSCRSHIIKLVSCKWLSDTCSSGLVRRPYASILFKWASCQIRKIAGAHAPGMSGTFSPSLQACDPDMHHGTCVTHVPWCMPGSLTSGFLWNRRRGETFPAFPAHAQSAILGIW